MKFNKNAIILCSGGIDSTVTAHYAKKSLGCKNVVILFFDYRQRSEKIEEKYARNCAKELRGEFFKVDLDWLGDISESLINKEGKVKRTSRKDLSNTKKTVKD